MQTAVLVAHPPPVDCRTGITSTKRWCVRRSRHAEYPEPLRRLHHLDLATKQRNVLVTNNFTLPAVTIAHLFKSSWQVEPFCKWISQHLAIKAFEGLSENAVRSQILITESVYVLVSIVRKQLNFDVTLHNPLLFLSLTLFESTTIPGSVLGAGSQFDCVVRGNQPQLLNS